MDKETVEFLLYKGADIARCKFLINSLVDRLKKAETVEEFKKIIPDMMVLEQELWKSSSGL
jgi:hypothetical protein